ncbi:HEPN domain-containing protein [Sediminihaliea albiluteola]|uniref:HEPN domain-containing protein n=1 Tax=Sediminihaliea albiluteola TaxID=2758564 RepID=UPI001C71724F|nr:HEPN domain-containing protein [Sediminihaliea albiluteola]
MSITYSDLKARQRAERESHSEGLALRTHRALSWLDRAEQCEDEDGKFIFLWIAFNAAYANEIVEGERAHEKKTFVMFLEKLVELDTEDTLYQLIWSEFSGSIRVLLNNQFVFEPFWEYQRGNISQEQWKSSFDSARTAANRALAEHRTADALSIILSRMYTLRNQLVHGGATWNSRVNRDQLSDCARFLGKLVPQIIKLMLDNPNTLWGDAVYPVVES